MKDEAPQVDDAAAAPVVAIDGPAAAGKGTVSKAVAAHFGFAHLDTGLLYRAVARKVLDGATAAQAAENLIAVMEGLTPAQSGGFFDYSGAEVPW